MNNSPLEPITYSIADACAVTSLGRTNLFRLIGEKKIDTVKIGGRTLVKAESLRRLLEAA